MQPTTFEDHGILLLITFCTRFYYCYCLLYIKFIITSEEPAGRGWREAARAPRPPVPAVLTCVRITRVSGHCRGLEIVGRMVAAP